jgi:hypothetical protein
MNATNAVLAENTRKVTDGQVVDHFPVSMSTSTSAMATAYESVVPRPISSSGFPAHCVVPASLPAQRAAAAAETRCCRRSADSAHSVSEAFKILVDAGADVNAKDEADFTALHGATFRGLNKVIQLLVDRGGRTPYRIAEGAKQSFQFQAFPETVELLKHLGAKSNLGIPGTVQERAPFYTEAVGRLARTDAGPAVKSQRYADRGRPVPTTDFEAAAAMRGNDRCPVTTNAEVDRVALRTAEAGTHSLCTARPDESADSPLGGR